MQVEILTKEDLKQFKAELVQELKDAFSGNAKPQNKEWLKSNEVRKLLGISPGTLQNLRINGTITYSKIGGMMYYRYQDILKLLEKGGVKMKKTPPELALLRAIQKHKGLGPFHISLYTAMLSLWQEQQYKTPFRVTRSTLMATSGIRSPATYHKCLKELIGHEYILYEPSFDKHRKPGHLGYGQSKYVK